MRLLRGGQGAGWLRSGSALSALLVQPCLAAAPPPAGEGMWGPGPPVTPAAAAAPCPEPRPDPDCSLQVQPAPAFVPNQ